MDSDDPVYVEDDQKLITAAALGLGDDECGLAETLDNLAVYGGRRLSTNVHAPGSLGRSGAWQFYKDMLQATCSPLWSRSLTQ